VYEVNETGAVPIPLKSTAMVASVTHAVVMKLRRELAAR